MLFLSPDKAGLLSTVLESVLYGFSALMFIGTLWTLLRGHPWGQVNHIMFVIACLLFILSTIIGFFISHLAVDINRLNSGFIRFRDSYPGGPVAWFANPSDSSFVFKNAVYSFQTVLGDGVVIYRCYKVWRSPCVVIFPVILWLAVAATAAGSVYSCTLPSTDPTSIYAQQLGKWITAFYSTTLSCNLVATTLLAYRLWSINRSVGRARLGGSLTLPVLLVVVDAGALYSITLLAALICFVFKSNGQYVVLDMVTPIISIAFYMVIVRVGIAQNSRPNTETSGSRPRAPLSRPEAPDRAKPMHVHIQVEQTISDRHFEMDKSDLPMERMSRRSGDL
ncbi:hypothetical protein B0H15DRAFT_938978 [Mycena belliarum]|uniref:Uncharacterized protein n=1 Tax=Mycena belliarum TaxID=1033014 RepID=A0AAD6U7U3_9AGAR|nr:hypothetical protein B0H15DRAFT_938978 [Mycena belliae]